MNKYVWLVETIQRAGEISLKEIQSKWLDSDLSEGAELSQRTFHKWRYRRALRHLYRLPAYWGIQLLYSQCGGAP